MTNPVLPEPTLTDALAFSWASQARQFPLLGPPGISHVLTGTGGYDETGRRVNMRIHSLLARDYDGFLVGILYYYPDDCFEVDGTRLESAGNVNVFVSPEHPRVGIGTGLLKRADARWTIDWSAQRYTPAGRALVARFLDQQ